MNRRIIDDLYAATEENLLFGIGLCTEPDAQPTPYVQIHYSDWTREKLSLVRAAFQAGLVVAWSAPTAGFRDLHISTRERMTIQAEHNGHTSLLHAPAWDAHLVRIDEKVARRFETERRRHGGFQLLIQTSEWDFLTAIDDDRNTVCVGAILPRSFPTPSDLASR